MVPLDVGMSLQMSKEHAPCIVAYSMEETVFPVKTFYKTSSFVTAQVSATGTTKICNHPSGTEVSITC
jgi:hypothetical protein